MKFLTVCAALLCLTAVILADFDEDRPCETDDNCPIDKCCVLSLLGDGKVCREMGDDHGDLCGGHYFCPQCGRSYLDCVAVPQGNDLHGCAHPANGTCVDQRRRRRP